MFCPENLKVNTLVQVCVPKPRDMFANFGLHDSANSSFSGAYVADRPMSKLEELDAIQRYEESRLESEEDSD